MKAASKDLQFGIDKCKAMIVSKHKPQQFQCPNIEVDSWSFNVQKDGQINEQFNGKVPLKLEKSLMYLGFVVSQTGGNMDNILHKRNKALGTQKQIAQMVQYLGPYTFEGGIIYTESLIRSSILYAAETMYNVTEKEYRTLESIEESVLLKLFDTLRSCPRHILYLECGLYPARYQVERKMLVFLQYILQQSEDSLLYKAFEAERTNPN